MRVFISHSFEDRGIAQKLARTLKHAGFTTFDVYADVHPGENWAARLSEALESADAMIVLVTPLPRT